MIIPAVNVSTFPLLQTWTPGLSKLAVVRQPERVNDPPTSVAQPCEDPLKAS